MNHSLSLVAKNTTIYSGVQIIEAVIALFLVPIYTRMLTPFEYGIVSLVLSITSIFVVIFTFNLPAACTRLYFNNPNDKTYVRLLWGTNFTFILVLSVLFFVIVSLVWQMFFQGVLNNVPFYPYILLGLVIVAVTPLFNLYQGTLKTRHQGRKFGYQQLLFLLSRVSLTIFFVVIVKMKAEGVLLAMAAIGVVFLVYTMIDFRKDIKLGVDKKLLKKSLWYSLPFMPARLSDWVMSSFDRVLLNQIKSTASVGLFQLGLSLGNLMNMFTAGFNEAFNPYFYQVIRTGDKARIEQIKKVSVMAVGLFSLIAVGMSLFSRELVSILTPAAYHASWKVVPLIAFANVFTSLDRLFRMPLEYHLGSGKYVSAVVLISSLLHGGLQFIFIPLFGFIGIGYVCLIVNFLMAMTYYVIAEKLQPFGWELWKIFGVVFIAISGCYALFAAESLNTFNGIALKGIGFISISSVIMIISMDGIGGMRRNYQLAMDILRRRES